MGASCRSHSGADNALRLPGSAFMVNIADTDAVKAWVRDDLSRRPAHD